jgi:hypothetical protein
MKRVAVISLALIVVAVIAAVLILHNNTSSGYDLKIPEGTQVSKIILESREHRIVLDQKRDSWCLNGHENARKTAIDLITTELEEMEPKSPVSENIVSSLKSKMSGNEVSVKVFSKGRKIRCFTVSHYNDHDYPSLFRKKHGSQSVLFYLPGYDIDPGSVFIADERYWRPFTIFKIRPSEIRQVTVDYPAEPARSFCIINKSGRVGLKDMMSFDTIAVRRYLSYFLNVPFESINTSLDAGEERAIKESVPYVNISVTTTDGDVKVLKGWKKINVNGENGETDTDRLWGQLNNGNMFVMRYFDVDPLLKKRSYFQQAK